MDRPKGQFRASETGGLRRDGGGGKAGKILRIGELGTDQRGR